MAFGACDFEGSHVGFVEDDGGFTERGVFHVEFAEGFDDWGLEFGWAVAEEKGFCGLVNGVGIGWSWVQIVGSEEFLNATLGSALHYNR